MADNSLVEASDSLPPFAFSPLKLQFNALTRESDTHYPGWRLCLQLGWNSGSLLAVETIEKWLVCFKDKGASTSSLLVTGNKAEIGKRKAQKKFGSPQGRGIGVFPVWKQVFQANLWVCSVSSYCWVPTVPQIQWHRAKMYVVAGECSIWKIHRVMEKDQIWFEMASVFYVWTMWKMQASLLLWSLPSLVVIVLQYAFLEVPFSTRFGEYRIHTNKAEVNYKGNIKTKCFLICVS